MNKPRQPKQTAIVGRQIELSERERLKLEGLCRQQQGLDQQAQQLQAQLQQMAGQIEQTKGRLAAVAEMVCEGHGIDPQMVRANWDGQQVTLTLLPIILPDEPGSAARTAHANGAPPVRA